MPSELLVFCFEGIISNMIKSWSSTASSNGYGTAEQYPVHGQTIRLVKDIGNTWNGSYRF